MHYDALPTSFDEPLPKKNPSPSSRLGIIALVLCLGLTLVNVYIARQNSHTIELFASHAHITRSYQSVDINSLRRPTQFIGLNRVSRPATVIARNFTSYPIVLAQVDEQRPKHVYNDDPKRYMARVGTISREDRRVQVTSSVSTIAQFRAIDYGMGICELRLEINSSARNDSGVEIYPSAPLIINIYRLDATTPVNTRTLSFSTKPRRVSTIDSVRLDYGSEWRRRFSCVTDQVLSFEFAISSDEEATVWENSDARVSWWQDKDRPTTAIYLMQHATV